MPGIGQGTRFAPASEVCRTHKGGSCVHHQFVVGFVGGFDQRPIGKELLRLQEFHRGLAQSAV